MIIAKRTYTDFGPCVVAARSLARSMHSPLDELTSQCRATVERRAPTYFRYAPAGKLQPDGEAGYSRLILPLWGNGHIGMLLGAVAGIR